MIKGLRIATRCASVERFVEAYHQICEETAIFIPNTQRPVDTVMQFRFDLQDGNPALLGIGTVVEELTTKHNRFDHVGIVVKLERLSRTSTITFDQMLAARARKQQLVAPAPVYPRAMTVPIEVIRVSKSERTTSAHLSVPIPIPTTSSTRTNPVIAAPTLAKKRMETVRIPAIIAPIRKEPPAVQPPPAPAVLAPSTVDDGWDMEPEPAPLPPPVVASPATTVAATSAHATSAAVVEDSREVSDGAVADITSAAADQSITVVMDDHESVGTPAVEPDLFDSVTAVEGPNELLLALMRGHDGRAAPAIMEAPQQPALLLGEPIVEVPEAAAMAPTLVPPPITFLPPIEHVPARATRRARQWLAAAGAFALLVCAIAATRLVIDRPVASAPPVSTFFVRTHERLETAVATTRDQAASERETQLPRAVTLPAIEDTKPRARSSTIERPSPRPQPATRPLRRPAAPRKCRNLGCL